MAEVQQGLRHSRAALEAAEAQLAARQEEVGELAQRLEAAQADIASLQVCSSAALVPDAAGCRSGAIGCSPSRALRTGKHAAVLTGCCAFDAQDCRSRHVAPVRCQCTGNTQVLERLFQVHQGASFVA